MTWKESIKLHGKAKVSFNFETQSELDPLEMCDEVQIICDIKMD